MKWPVSVASDGNRQMAWCRFTEVLRWLYKGQTLQNIQFMSSHLNAFIQTQYRQILWINQIYNLNAFYCLKN